MSELYRCAICEGEFMSIWPDEAAKAEYEELFGKPYGENDAATVCDDCFFAALARMSVQSLEPE